MGWQAGDGSRPGGLPGAGECLPELVRRACSGPRHMQVDGEQRDSDREDRVAEEQHPVVLDEAGARQGSNSWLPAVAGLLLVSALRVPCHAVSQ